MKSMKDQYGSKRGEQVFYASMNKGKIKGVEKKKNGGLGQKSGPPPKKGPSSQGLKLNVLKAKGGADASKADFGTGASARDAGMGMAGKTGKSDPSLRSGSGGTTKTTTVTARKGPTQVPVIGPVSFVANKVLESMYHSKNLKEQKKEDVLGGEMLTQGRRTTTTTTRDGGDGGQQPIKITPTKVASTSTVPIPLMKVKPKTFDFEYKEGGLVRGSGKVLKGKVKKARIY